MIVYEQIGKLGEWLQIKDLIKIVKEIEEDRELLTDIESSVHDVDFFKTKSWTSIHDLGLYRIAIYVICRALNPEFFIETGVLHGLTSMFALHAIRRNRYGILLSIDAPSYFETGPANQDGIYDVLPPGKEPGWVISEKYKIFWELFLGRSSEMLPRVLTKHPNIDIFLHDSEHTYETMMMEFNIAWKALKEGGLLICDNINLNTSFFDFCINVNRIPIIFPNGGPDTQIDKEIRFGIIHK